MNRYTKKMNAEGPAATAAATAEGSPAHGRGKPAHQDCWRRTEQAGGGEEKGRDPGTE